MDGGFPVAATTTIMTTTMTTMAPGVVVVPWKPALDTTCWQRGTLVATPLVVAGDAHQSHHHHSIQSQANDGTNNRSHSTRSILRRDPSSRKGPVQVQLQQEGTASNNNNNIDGNDSRNIHVTLPLRSHVVLEQDPDLIDKLCQATVAIAGEGSTWRLESNSKKQQQQQLRTPTSNASSRWYRTVSAMGGPVLALAKSPLTLFLPTTDYDEDPPGSNTANVAVWSQQQQPTDHGMATAILQPLDAVVNIDLAAQLVQCLVLAIQQDQHDHAATTHEQWLGVWSWTAAPTTTATTGGAVSEGRNSTSQQQQHTNNPDVSNTEMKLDEDYDNDDHLSCPSWMGWCQTLARRRLSQRDSLDHDHGTDEKFLQLLARLPPKQHEWLVHCLCQLGILSWQSRSQHSNPNNSTTLSPDDRIVAVLTTQSGHQEQDDASLQVRLALFDLNRAYLHQQALRRACRRQATLAGQAALTAARHQQQQPSSSRASIHYHLKRRKLYQQHAEQAEQILLNLEASRLALCNASQQQTLKQALQSTNETLQQLRRLQITSRTTMPAAASATTTTIPVPVAEEDENEYLDAQQQQQNDEAQEEDRLFFLDASTTNEDDDTGVDDDEDLQLLHELELLQLQSVDEEATTTTTASHSMSIDTTPRLDKVMLTPPIHCHAKGVSSKQHRTPTPKSQPQQQQQQQRNTSANNNNRATKPISHTNAYNMKESIPLASSGSRRTAATTTTNQKQPTTAHKPAKDGLVPAITGTTPSPSQQASRPGTALPSNNDNSNPDIDSLWKRLKALSSNNNNNVTTTTKMTRTAPQPTTTKAPASMQQQQQQCSSDVDDETATLQRRLDALSVSVRPSTVDEKPSGGVVNASSVISSRQPARTATARRQRSTPSAATSSTTSNNNIDTKKKNATKKQPMLASAF